MNHSLNLSELKNQLLQFKYVIADQTVLDLYPELLSKHIVFPFVALEKNKTQDSVNQLHKFLFEHHITKHEHLIVMGGGITLDMAGFALATYHRGIPFTSVPTTLLAMVDVSHGGKVGINTPYGKNTLGTFYCANHVLLCPKLLDTLPWIEIQNGISEMLKHLIISGEYHFPQPQILTQQDAIIESINIKKKITHQDPYDLGIRQCLNLGHTLAHAAETASNHCLSHGQAVAWGLLIEGHILEEKTQIKPYTHALKNYFNAHFKLPTVPKLPILWQAMQRDKKNTEQVCISALSEPYIYPTTYDMWKHAIQITQ